jgi:aspartyl-tRNA(Asn)/glutamyl-tRNA(Gln) amidotransferase subunit C
MRFGMPPPTSIEAEIGCRNCAKNRSPRTAAQRQDNTPSPRRRPTFGQGRDPSARVEIPPISAMSLSSSDISRIATLARLDLRPEESERMLSQINGFFDIVERMRTVETHGIEPLSHPVATVRDIALRLRADAVSEGNEREANQRSAPATEDGLFLVPRVIE